MRINIEMFIIAIIAKKFLTNYLLSHSQNDNNKYIPKRDSVYIEAASE